MFNNIFKKSKIWIYCILSLFLAFIIFIVVIISIVGPRDFIDDCLELFGGKKKENWAFLVAGSKGWNNYRHQADIAHAYQTLLKNGIPVSHIIVMMTDDVAFDNQNPNPGQLFNNPNGSDVYHGLQIDYKGKDVSSVNFLNVLTGNKTSMQNVGSGRVIERDNIFVNFVGHGTSGILAFPENYLYADELNISLESMFINQKFNKMLLYVESCRAGSLFDGILSENNNIFAVTASGPRESSWSTYCFGDDKISIICLGDEFSVTWIEDQENIGKLYSPNINEWVEKRTVLNHFNYIRTTVKQSNVMPYGDISVGQDKLSKYIGKPPGVFYKNINNNIQSSWKNNTMPSLTVPINAIKFYQLFKQNNTLKQHTIRNNITRQIIDKLFDAIIQDIKKRWPNFIEDMDKLKKLPSNLPLSAFQCYRQSLDHIIKKCFSLPKNTYSLYSLHIFFNLCTKVSNGKSVEFDMMFEGVVHNICSKNVSKFSSIHKMTNIY